MQDLTGAAALVTGASSGIGAATAAALAEAGADVTVAARREQRLRDLADRVESEHDRTVAVAPTDVTDPGAVGAAVEATVERFGGLDVAVSNAGVGRGDEVAAMDDEQFDAMMRVNCYGTFHLARAALPRLRESAGTLVFVGSIAGEYPRPYNPVYAATKWWTRGFAHSLAAQVGDEGVGVTTVNPSEVRTEFFSEEGTPLEERFEPGTVTEPEDVAAAVVFAARQEPPNTVHELDLYRRDKLCHF